MNVLVALSKGGERENRLCEADPCRTVSFFFFASYSFYLSSSSSYLLKPYNRKIYI